MDEYRELFVTEAQEQLQSLEQHLLRLEKDPAEVDAIHGTFRVLHTLKGMSGTLGLTEIAQVAHEAESYLDRLRRGEARLDRTGADILLATRDWLAEAATAVARRAPEPEGAPLVARLRGLAGAAPPAPIQRAHVRVDLTPDARAPGLRILSILSALSRWGKVRSSAPEAASVPDDARSLEAVVDTRLPHQELRRRLADLVDVQAVTVAPPAGSAPRPGAVGLTRTKQTTIRVPTRQLDEMVDAMGEIVLSRARLADLARTRDDPALTEAVDRLDRLTAGLYDNVLKARTLPLDTVVARFPRMVRDLAQQGGKEVDLVLQGTSVELDRSVVEEAADPLVHILRNAIDHGIESPAERARAGKPARGTITIAARREHNRVIIDVTDDGRGIDPDRIRATAVARGVASADEAVRLTPAEAHLLLFRPGFTTTEGVSQTSGRGVGLDSVKRWVERMGGSVRVSSRPGHGTTMALDLPLTLAVVHGLIVRVGEHRYVVPVDQVEATVDLWISGLHTLHGQEVVRWNDRLVPLLRLSAYLGSGAPDAGYAIVVAAPEGHLALAIDDVVGQDELVVKALDRTIVPNREYGGATILGDGSVALIINVAEVAADARPS